MQKLSAIVITYNEENNIKDCLDSISWADEIVVVDSNSDDRTREIASAYTANIINCGNGTYGEKRNAGIEKATGEWIFWLDADERVSEELKNEIQKTISSDSPSSPAFLINRKSFFINKFIKHCGWYPDYTLRLFRKDTGLKFDSSLVHESIIYKGKKEKLKTELLHYTDPTFEHYLVKLNNYTTLSAKELSAKNKKFSIFDIIFRPAFTFFKMYFLKLGFLDGYMGLILCILSGFHVFMKYSKVYLSKPKD